MKKIIFLLVTILTMAITACSNTEEKDECWKDKPWAGTYEGVLPCADCQGIETKIVLNPDYSYKLVEHYIVDEENEYITEGKFTVEDNVIILEDKEADVKMSNRYMIGEDTLIKLDMAGNVIEGDIAEKYILKRRKIKVEGNIFIKFGTSIKL